MLPGSVLKAPQQRSQARKTQGVATAGQAVGQVQHFGKILGRQRLGQRRGVMFQRLAQYLQQALQLLFTQQRAVGVQQ
ncbi:hypothetical protein D3C86_2014450 [compost metagenome]